MNVVSDAKFNGLSINLAACNLISLFYIMSICVYILLKETIGKTTPELMVTLVSFYEISLEEGILPKYRNILNTKIYIPFFS